jgi:hypothetical protein
VPHPCAAFDNSGDVWAPVDGSPLAKCSGECPAVDSITVYGGSTLEVPANNCQAPFLCNQPVNNKTIGPPIQWRPAKQTSTLSNYLAFLGCYGVSVSRTITDEEYEGKFTAYGIMNAGALAAIKYGAVFTPIGFTFVASAGLMDLSAGVKANLQCTAAIYR